MGEGVGLRVVGERVGSWVVGERVALWVKGSPNNSFIIFDVINSFEPRAPVIQLYTG